MKKLAYLIMELLTEMCDSMEAKTENHQLDSELILYESSFASLTVHIITFSLTKQNKEIKACHLTFCVTCELYQRIETEALFNLKPEVRTPLSNGDFQPSPDIQIEAILKPLQEKQLPVNKYLKVSPTSSKI